MCALFSQKNLTFSFKKCFFQVNMILVGNWKVELDFRVLAPTSIYVTYVIRYFTMDKLCIASKELYETHIR